MKIPTEFRLTDIPYFVESSIKHYLLNHSNENEYYSPAEFLFDVEGTLISNKVKVNLKTEYNIGFNLYDSIDISVRKITDYINININNDFINRRGKIYGNTPYGCGLPNSIGESKSIWKSIDINFNFRRIIELPF